MAVTGAIRSFEMAALSSLTNERTSASSVSRRSLRAGPPVLLRPLTAQIVSTISPAAAAKVAATSSGAVTRSLMRRNDSYSAAARKPIAAITKSTAVAQAPSRIDSQCACVLPPRFSDKSEAKSSITMLAAKQSTKDDADAEGDGDARPRIVRDRGLHTGDGRLAFSHG